MPLEGGPSRPDIERSREERVLLFLMDAVISRHWLNVLVVGASTLF